MRLAFYYISSCQTTLPEFRHLNTVRKQEVFEKNEYNLKKLIKYKYNPCNIEKWDFHPTIFKGSKTPRNTSKTHLSHNLVSRTEKH